MSNTSVPRAAKRKQYYQLKHTKLKILKVKDHLVGEGTQNTKSAIENSCNTLNLYSL